MFRHIAFKRGAGPASVEQLEDLVDVSVSESTDIIRLSVCDMGW